MQQQCCTFRLTALLRLNQAETSINKLARTFAVQQLSCLPVASLDIGMTVCASISVVLFSLLHDPSMNKSHSQA